MSKILSWYKQQPVEGTIYPISREGHSLTFIDNLGILMFGGFGASLLAEFYIYDIGSNQWRVFKTGGRQISPRCYHTKIFHDPYLFIYAGQGEKGRSLGDTYSLDIRDPELKWKKVLVEPPYPRHEHTLCGFRKTHPRYEEMQRYLFGGINTPENILFNDVWIFDFGGLKSVHGADDLEGCNFKKIETVGKPPSARKGHSALCYDRSMYVFGGQTQDINDSEITKYVHVLDLVDYFWTRCDVSLAKISPRCQISTTWLTSNTVLFFGGLNNKTNKGLNDIFCLDLDEMQFTFPFTAGEYPEPRSGHASCNYKTPDSDKESLMLLGGINHGFCTMDIYTLVEIERREGQIWEKIIKKEAYEEKAHKSASKFVYAARKHCLDLHDLILEEKSKGIQIRKEDQKINQDYLKVVQECEEAVKEKEEEIDGVDLEISKLKNEIDSLVKTVEYEEYYSQVLEDKSKVLQNYFMEMQTYMNLTDWNFLRIRKENKKAVTKKDRELKTLKDNYKKSIEINRKKYQDGLLFLKHYYEQSVIIRTDAEKKFDGLVEELSVQVPSLKEAAQITQNYEAFLKEEAEKAVILETEQSDEETFEPDNKLKGYKIGPERKGRY